MKRLNLKFGLKLALELFVFIGLCRFASAAQVQNLRFGSQTDSSARIVIDLSQKSAFRVFPLKNPSRVVVDLKNTRHGISERQLPRPPSYLKGIRLGTTNGNSARIVLELNRDVVIKKSFILAPQSGFLWRLVVDLELRGRAEPLKQVTSEWYDNSVSQQRKKAQPVLQTHNKRLIVLDPGHGGKDPGAIGVSGVYEKHLTLAMAKQLRSLLERTGRYRVRLTRETDVSMALYARRRFARSLNADLFLSIHADSIKKPQTRGLSVYTLSERASDKEAEKLAESENKADLIAGLDLSGETQEVTDILIDLARRETNNHSSFFAEKMVHEIKKVITVLPNSHRFAGFAVLKSPDVPSILMEMGYLSNKEEERLLRQASYREKLARATVSAIDSYFAEKHKANFN